MSAPTLQELQDRQEITDVLVRYTMALDAHDWARLDEVFVPSAVATYGGGLHGEGREAIVDVCRNALSGLTSSQHLIGNVSVQVDGDRATSVCYLHAMHYYVQATGLKTFIVAGTYRDELVRTEHGWRIQHRVLERTWEDGNAGLIAEAAAAHHAA